MRPGEALELGTRTELRPRMRLSPVQTDTRQKNPHGMGGIHTRTVLAPDVWTSSGIIGRPMVGDPLGSAFIPNDRCSELGQREMLNAIQKCSRPAQTATVAQVIPPFLLAKTNSGAGVTQGFGSDG